ncbi:MAG: flagellar FlbD family protein [Oscillospiraceae bacterium]|nr:flagellar FlbD family protein [Oscillospiraceae bacterium]
MIELTKLNDIPFVLNDDLIETIEETPDTTIRLTTKNYLIVKESMREVIAKVIAFRRETNGAISLRKSD